MMGNLVDKPRSRKFLTVLRSAGWSQRTDLLAVLQLKNYIDTDRLSQTLYKL